MYTACKSDIKEYIAFPHALSIGCSENLAIFRADGGNHFTQYGIHEGMFLIFDLDKDFTEGRLSCFINNEDNTLPKYKVSNKPLPGYSHFGRLALSLRNYEVQS